MAISPNILTGPVAVGIAAGVGSALLFVAGAGGSLLMAILLFMLAPLPTFIAGLGWGPRAIVAAGVAGMAASAAIQGPQLAVIHLVGLAFPVGLLCWLAHLRRPAQPPAAIGGASPDEWFTAGNLVLAIALMAGAIAAFSVLSIGTDVETIARTSRGLLERQMKAWVRAGGRELGAAELEALTSLFVRLLPAATAMSWMFMMTLNMWLAGRVLRTSRRLFRPWPHIAALTLPPWLSLAFAAAVAVSLGSGMPALIASGFASAFVTAYAAVGLAVLHWITYGKGNRGFTLAAAYLSALMLAPYGTLPVALLGFLDRWLGLRNRGPGPPPLPPPPANDT